MYKYILIFCLLTLSISKQISDEDLNKYYDYAVLFLKGLANSNETKCANLLETQKDFLMTIVKDVMIKIDEGKDIYSAIFTHILEIMFLEKDCHLTELLTLYAGTKNKKIFEDKLYNIGQVLPEALNYYIK